MPGSILHMDVTKPKVRVVLFSGGRGSRVLSKELINHPYVELTLAVNGYDDGASTGEVRRFLGDSLGPSDFRKNASRMARELHSCSPELVELLDLRLPNECTPADARAHLQLFSGVELIADDEFSVRLKTLVSGVDEPSREAVWQKMECFLEKWNDSGSSFDFSDCSLGNLIFAGCYLEAKRDFNETVKNYCALLDLPSDMILNVTDGTNAYLVALDSDYRFLSSEAEIVAANRRNYILDIFLLQESPGPAVESELERLPPESRTEYLDGCSIIPKINAGLSDKVRAADLIIYSPGTQHSSLFPSYLTSGLGEAIAANLTAIKLLITNVREDSEIPDSSAVEIVEKAVRYLREKNRLNIPIPLLITHYLMNDPQKEEPKAPYVPLGRLETLEDPRLVRIGDFEEGKTGTHDAARVLTPFVESILQKGKHPEIAVFLLETDSMNKISQTILEMLRAGASEQISSMKVFYSSETSLDEKFVASIPFEVRNIGNPGSSDRVFRQTIVDQNPDYVILFESSGMYRGEDIVNLAALLNHRKLDAVWGSRRLSIRDVHQSYKLRYRHNLALGTFSYLGSHLLSLAYLLLHGRYLSDTLSGARAVRAAYLVDTSVDLGHRCMNQQILSAILRNRGEIFETPVQFFSISPEKVRRTTVFDGVRALITIVQGRFMKTAKGLLEGRAH